ncbi:hypothetical protein D3C73_1362310 [compost metagenome]
MLTPCNRLELRDHAFGDKEVYFETTDGKTVAEGYAGREYTLSIGEVEFTGAEARQLLALGNLTKVDRNDSGADDEEPYFDDEEE